MLGVRKFSETAGGPSSRNLSISMAILLPVVILSALLFAAMPSEPYALLPLIGFTVWRFFPQLGANADQKFLLGFLVVCFLIDDISYGPWGAIDSVTEAAGQLLFRSFGINGMEACLIAFTFFIAITTRKEDKRQWNKLKLPQLLLIASVILIPALLAALWGMVTGGTLTTALIQIRYLYLMPLWVFVGFAVIRDKSYFERIFFWLTVTVVLKSIQALFIWVTNRAYFAQYEYLYEHFFSAYATTSVFLMAYYFYKHKALHMRLLNGFGIVVTVAALALNDRRTSYAAVIFALISLLFLLPPALHQRYRRMLIVFGLCFATFSVVTWPLPIGTGAVIRSLQDDPTKGPSYRDLENGNIMREVSRNPLTGMGYGHEFDEFYPMPSVAAVYPRYKMIPHNVFLATWCYGGPLTMAGLSLYFIFLFSTAGRLVSAEGMQGLRFVGVLCLVYFMQYFSYVFGDLGLQVNRLELLGGLFIGAAFRLLSQRQLENRLW
ncbi:MAG: O-antigen ligase family protein [Bdellovibrionota bacterium]